VLGTLIPLQFIKYINLINTAKLYDKQFVWTQKVKAQQQQNKQKANLKSLPEPVIEPRASRIAF